MWHVVQSSWFECLRIMCGAAEPCGLWQLEQSIPPSRSGMCALRAISARLSSWHERQSSVGRDCDSSALVPALFGSWMLWQLWHETSFRACELWSQWNCSPIVWQERQTAAWASGLMRLKTLIAWKPGRLSSPSASAWSDPGAVAALAHHGATRRVPVHLGAVMGVVLPPLHHLFVALDAPGLTDVRRGCGGNGRVGGLGGGRLGCLYGIRCRGFLGERSAKKRAYEEHNREGR